MAEMTNQCKTPLRVSAKEGMVAVPGDSGTQRVEVVAASPTTINPGETSKVEWEARCIDPDKSWPCGSNMNVNQNQFDISVQEPSSAFWRNMCLWGVCAFGFAIGLDWLWKSTILGTTWSSYQKRRIQKWNISLFACSWLGGFVFPMSMAASVKGVTIPWPRDLGVMAGFGLMMFPVWFMRRIAKQPLFEKIEWTRDSLELNGICSCVCVRGLSRIRISQQSCGVTRVAFTTRTGSTFVEDLRIPTEYCSHSWTVFELIRESVTVDRSYCTLKIVYKEVPTSQYVPVSATLLPSAMGSIGSVPASQPRQAAMASSSGFDMPASQRSQAASAVSSSSGADFQLVAEPEGREVDIERS